MYFSSVLTGIRRTIQLAENTLSEEATNNNDIRSIHTIINRLNTNIHNLFRQLNHCLNSIPFLFETDTDANLINSVLNRIYEKGAIQTKDLPEEDLEKLQNESNSITFGSVVVFNYNNQFVRQRYGRWFLNFIVDKLEELDDILNRLSLRAKLGEEPRDKLAYNLLIKYSSIIGKYITQLESSLFIRSQIRSTNIHEYSIEPLKTIQNL